MCECCQEPYEMSIIIIVIIVPFFRCKNWYSKKLNSYLRVLQPVSNSTRIITQANRTPKSLFLTSTLSYKGRREAGRENGARKDKEKGRRTKGRNGGKQRPARERGVETVTWVKEMKKKKKPSVKENTLFNSNFKMTNLLSQWTVVKQLISQWEYFSENEEC